jgi:membrane fusion protein, multidrug efflux system
MLLKSRDKLLVDQNKVYVVRDGTLVLVEVEPVYNSSEKVVVKGLQDGAYLISSPGSGSLFRNAGGNK